MDNQVELQSVPAGITDKQPETIPQAPTELERIASLRKQLGLPEKSPLLDTQKIAEEDWFKKLRFSSR